MTKREREQVVELLRCAADLGMQKVFAPMSLAGELLGLEGSHIEDLADAAAIETGIIGSAIVENMWSDFAVNCLEAAARVEEGSYP